MKRNKFVLDSYAILALLQNENGADQVEKYLHEAKKGTVDLLLSLMNWSEVYYSIWKSKGEDMAENSVLAIRDLPIRLIDINYDLVHQAAKFKGQHSLSYADCFAAALAKREECPVVTGDKEFESIKEKIAVIWLKGK